MPEYRIHDMPAPLPGAIVDKLMQVETATVGHFRHWGFMDRRIQGLLPGVRVVGCAVTIQVPAQDSTMVHHAMGQLRPGDFVIVDRLGDDKHACWGGGVTKAARAARAVGGVVDGPCTDLAEIRESNFPMWCRGISPITTRVYNLAGTLNAIVSCGGVAVRPGDAILADDSGVLVLPRDEAEAIADQAIAMQERGRKNEGRVAAGEKLGEISGASKLILDALAKR
ncbi:MAG: RraA family protein [Alphaproteobacteria bacterium]|nr:RraA family protein [Alphaproteobacteria bacterium]